MIKTKDREKEPERKDIEKERKIKELDFDYCPKHNSRYPKGAECPRCEEERRRRNN